MTRKLLSFSDSWKSKTALLVLILVSRLFWPAEISSATTLLIPPSTPISIPILMPPSSKDPGPPPGGPTPTPGPTPTSPIEPSPTPRTTNTPAPSNCDGFEGNAFDPSWTVTEQYGTVTLSSEQSHAGNQSAKFSSVSGGDRDILLSRSLPSLTKGTVSVWFYDTAPGQETLYGYLEVYDSNNPQSSTSFYLGIRDWMADVYDQYGQGNNLTTIPRSLGWHHFQIMIGATNGALWIDGIPVHSFTGDFSFDRVRLHVFGPWWRPDATYYYDDLCIMPGLPIFSTVRLPLVMNNWCEPNFRFTYVPPRGSTNKLQGWVDTNCVKPANSGVAVYILVQGGWWTKPYWNQPVTPIQSNGNWSTNIVTGGNDQNATQITACLIPSSYNPPLMSGGSVLPQELYDNATACISADRS